MPKLLLLLAEVVIFAVLGVIASSHFGLADGLKITLAYLTAYLVPRITLTRARASSTTACVILLLLATLLIMFNYRRLCGWTFFDEFSLQEPNIGGDGRGFYKWALNKYDGRVEAGRIIFPGFSLLMLGLWKIFGLSVVWPQAMNMMFTLTSVVLTGMTTRRLLAHRVSVSPQVLLSGGMALSYLLLYYLVMGTAILKEASVFISISMAGYALAAMGADDKERHKPWRELLLFALACALFGLVRTTYLYFILLGVFVMTMAHPRRNWRISLAMVVMVGLGLLGGDMLSAYSFDRHAEIAGGGWNMQRFYVDSESQRFYHDMLDYYFLDNVWHKVLMLPVTMSVQFFIPLPWNYYENPSLINSLARMTYGWYFIGGTALFYFAFASWRRDLNMGWWAWWAALSYAAIAYLMAGSVARYVTPIQPLFIPVAIYVLCRLWEGRWRKAYLIWVITLVVLIALALCLCLEIQQKTFSTMWHTQSLENYVRGLPY